MHPALTFVIQSFPAAPTRRRRVVQWTCCNNPSRRTSSTHDITTTDGATLNVTTYAAVSDAQGSVSHVPVLLVHDFMTDARLFTRLACTTMLQGRTLITPDLRGFGSSSLPSGRYSRTADLRTVADGTRPHVVGVGLGGTAALELTLANPADVRSVTLIGSGLPGHAWSDAALYLNITEARRVGKLLARGGPSTSNDGKARDVVMWKQKFIAANRTWGDLLSTGDRQVASEALAMARDYSGFHFFRPEQLDPDPFEGPPLSERICNVEVPVQVMVGERDTTDFRAIASEIWTAVKNGGEQVMHVPEAGHFAVMEQADWVAARLAAFWDQVEAGEDAAGESVDL